LRALGDLGLLSFPPIQIIGPDDHAPRYRESARGIHQLSSCRPISQAVSDQHVVDTEEVRKDTHAERPRARAL
jgi:hypothetical protein